MREKFPCCRQKPSIWRWRCNNSDTPRACNCAVPSFITMTRRVVNRPDSAPLRFLQFDLAVTVLSRRGPGVRDPDPNERWRGEGCGQRHVIQNVLLRKTGSHLKRPDTPRCPDSFSTQCGPRTHDASERETSCVCERNMMPVLLGAH